ncbi:MAG: nicotinate phosphoribosyltransferase [Phycisphaerales bacterium]
MWLIDASPTLFTDLYEFTMAQAYYHRGMDQVGHFEVFVRDLPEHWGFFVMAGLPEVKSYIREFRFSDEDLLYLRSTRLFESDFLVHLATMKLDVKIRALPEGAVFFPNEPILEVSGPIVQAQLLETYILNILGFSVIEATLAARMMIAARGASVVDFGLRRCQGPISAIRAARGGQMAGFDGTSNLSASRLLDLPPSGTMAHSFVEVHESEEQAFRTYAEIYGDRTILLVDTYDSIEGIKIAARVAKDFADRGVRIRGIRLDSGDLVELSRFARDHFRKTGVEFLSIFASGDLDEFRIAEMLDAGAEIDGFGVGTRFTVSQHAPAIGIVYKIARYGDRDLYKTSTNKGTIPGRKTILRTGHPLYEKDTIIPFEPGADDLLQPFEFVEPMPVIQKRLRRELSALPDLVERITEPAEYPVDFIGFSPQPSQVSAHSQGGACPTDSSASIA